MSETFASGAFRPSSRYAWYVVILLTLTQITAYIDRFLPALLIQPIKQTLHLTEFQVGLLLGPAFAVFFVTLGLPIGWLADRWSRRALLAIGIAIWCCMTTAGGFAQSFLPLFGARLGLGVGEAAVGPCALSLVSDYFPPERRARAVSLLMSGTFIGAGSAFLFGGPFVHWIASLPPLHGQWPWQTCFLFMGLPGLVLAALMLTVREPPRGDSAGGVGDAPSPRFIIGFMAARWRVFGTLFVGSACNLTLGVLTVWNVALFQRTWGWNVAWVGMATGILFFTGGPLGTLIGIGITNRAAARGRRDATMIALLTGILIAVPSFALFPLMPTAAAAIVFLFLAFVGQAMATAAGPASFTLIVAGSMRAQATAIYYLIIGVIGQMLGPPPVGWMVDRFGDPHSLRYAVSIEAAIVGLPSLVLVSLGIRHFRRHVDALAAEIAPAAASMAGLLGGKSQLAMGRA